MSHDCMIGRDAMMVNAEAILIDDENVTTLRALESRCPRLELLSEDAIRTLRQATYVTLDHAADVIGTAAVCLKRLIRRGDLTVLDHDGQLYVSLQSALDYRDRSQARMHAGLQEMFRVTQEAGLYDIELDLYRK